MMNSELPTDCLIVVGLPYSEASFHHSIERSHEAYGAQFELGGWARYLNQWIKPLDRFLGVASSLGVEVIKEASLGSIKPALSERQYAAFLLISHWTSEGVEFNSGFVPAPSLANQIPTHYFGVIDLCICHPIELVQHLQVVRPQNNIRYSPKKVRPSYWFLFYEALFKLLASGQHSYASGWELISASILESSYRRLPNQLEACK